MAQLNGERAAESCPEAGQRPVVILGSGLAGYGVAREFRKLDGNTPLLMITADDGASYSKPMLSTGFTKGKAPAGLVQAEAGAMAEQLRMEVRTHTQVTAIDPSQRCLYIGSEPLYYDRLVLALGAEVIDLQLPGTASDRVLSINDIEDYGRFRAQLPEAGHVVILGAGLIGCEFANDLRNGGYGVTVVAPSDQVMPGLLPAPAAVAVKTALESEGARFLLGKTAVRVDQREGGVQVELDDGSALQADLVLSAVGLRARTGLAADAGLEVGQGIRVNRQLETSAPGVYALGDCAEVDGLVLMYVLPLMASARALAKTLAGEPTAVAWGAMPVMVKTPCCPTAVSPPAAGATGDWEVQQEGMSVKALFRGEGDALLGFALTGDAALEKQSLTRELPPLHDT